MAGGVNSLLDISKRALFAQTQAIRVLGDNIANVNTDGYSRREAILQPGVFSGRNETGFVGSGVEVDKIVRNVDEFLNREVVNRINERAKSSIRDEFLGRAEQPFSLDATAGRIGYQLSAFFSSLEDLAANPGDLPLRSNVVEKGNSLAQSIKNTYNHLASLQREADTRIGVAVDDINRTTAELATLNAKISGGETAKQQNLTLRDQRDQLIRELSEKISIRTIENTDGSVNVTLDNGFGIVTGFNSRDLEFTKSPDFGTFPPGLDGSSLGHIVFDYDPSSVGTSHVDLTEILASGGGEVSGLLTFRGIQADTDTTAFDAVGDLPEAAARVEAIAQDLLTRFNTSYLGDDEDASTPLVHDASSGDLDGDPPDVYGLFTFVGADDVDNDGLPNDLTAIGLPNYASIIDFGFSDPSDLAAALDLNPADGATSFAPGDASNIENLIELRNDPLTYTLGNFTATGTIEDVYNSAVTFIGSSKHQAANDLSTAEERETQIEGLRSSVSGVNLDEEFANLINFQRAFQASARMIKTGDELTTEVLGLFS